MNGIVHKGREFWLWGVAIAAFAAIFICIPGNGADKSRAVLHGLCAQTPSHSFSFGGTLLPFDARMTGIYGGALATIVTLIATRRVFFYGNPPIRVILVLAAGVLFMAIDGFNSLFTDLGIWHPYETRNELRLITGYFSGVALGTALIWLLGSSMWRASSADAGVKNFRDLALPFVILVPFFVILMSGWSPLATPLSWLLMGAAWLTLSILMLVVVLLLFRYEDQIETTGELHIPGTVASVLALLIMLGMAGGRFWLERTIGVPALV